MGNPHAGTGGTHGGGRAASGGTGNPAQGGSAGSAGSGAGSIGSGVDPGEAGKAPYDWVGVVGTGQSLGVGWESTAIHTSPSAYGNLVLRDDGPDPKYPIDDSGSPVWSAVPLMEPIRPQAAGYSGSGYPNNIWFSGSTYGESPHSGMADSVSLYCQARKTTCITAHTVVGIAGALLNTINKGTDSFNAAIHEAKVFKQLADTAGKTYGIGSIVLTHGEQDASNPTYGASLYTFWSDYNSALKAVTGQSDDIVMLASQQSSSASNYGSSYGSAIQLWQLSVDHPEQIVVTGPKYQYGPYGLHMSAESYARVGEKYGEVHDSIVNRKIAWRPLEPTGVTRAGAVLTIHFHVPNPPLVWDDTLAMPHQAAHTAWSQGRGLEVLDSSMNELEITSVDIQDDDVVLTLAQDPGAGALTLGYAVTQDTQESNQGGTDLGPHGQLRDSDPFTGPSVDTTEYNYCVHFALAVP
jgi:hypothetical protein